MSSRTRTRASKRAAGVHTVQIPRQRGRRGAQPFVVVVPERPSLTREAFGFLARLLWKHRRAMAPLTLATVALPVTALLHWWAWWSGLLLAPLAVAPLTWLAFALLRRRAGRSVLLWRIGLATGGTSALAWLALAAGFGPTAGPLPVLWLLVTLAVQTAWLAIRRKG
ncbi:integral membrane protein [Streptomyces viridochromogenes DSM 40736]|uniref:Integral membrane protein n=1 Tax=Streptomyces viridochromogenes (strain DSM 40736 / JCM 4977 / BCRC 1201 / Tue 494) TaxID=591159 RepID=D9X401_STRVT|nr:hypothetical protein [Streptomyces viridochromogenes]EFL33811.1 integral membrane protein [Streptomyces viridochromogenes DSM 40736]